MNPSAQAICMITSRMNFFDTQKAYHYVDFEEKDLRVSMISISVVATNITVTPYQNIFMNLLLRFLSKMISP